MTKSIFYAPYIDGLRAVAVLSVIVYHLNGAWLPGGFAGVDVFFVISGFVVSTSVHKMQSVGAFSFMANFDNSSEPYFPEERDGHLRSVLP